MLSSDEHDVIVVEPDIERGNIINEKLDVQVVNGNGASPRLQRAIGIGNADLVVAVTDRDEINMLSCTFAKQAGAKRTVARLRDIEYANDIAALRRLMPEVDVFINPEQVTAEVISNYIRIPEAKNIYYFDKRKLMMVELPVAPDSLVNGKALKDLPKIKPFLITSILRDGRFIIPNGNEIIREHDYIFLMTRTEDMKEIERSLGFKRKVIQEVMILGGGRLGYYLAKILEPMDVQVKIIEQNLKRCEFLSGMLDTTIVLNGDVGDADILAEEGISDVDILVASTDNDKLNILACLLGAQAWRQADGDADPPHGLYAADPVCRYRCGGGSADADTRGHSQAHPQGQAGIADVDRFRQRRGHRPHRQRGSSQDLRSEDQGYPVPTGRDHFVHRPQRRRHHPKRRGCCAAW